MGDAADLQILSVMTDAAASSHTGKVLARRVGESLRHLFPETSVELVWIDEVDGASERSFSFDGDDVRESVRPLTCAGQQAADEGVSINDNGRQLAARVPMRVLERVTGYARFEFARTTTPVLPSEATLELIGRILGFGQSHCRLVERVAKLSASAHHDSAELRQELRKHVDTDDIVARSTSMLAVLRNVGLVAQHDSAVLLRGESGTGKELLARRIHRLSKRANRPFVAVNCGAMPETLVESELFGHEKGAFTGATGRHVGRFERAHGGTIFLDEVAELPPAAQVKLLRVLQDGVFERVGGGRSVRVDVRVLAATHRPLEAMIEAGTFRSDLFYRINVFPIDIPPLRERPEDIPALAHTLLQQTARRLGVASPPFGPSALDRLSRLPWHGNVRELANTIERALISRRAATLDFEDLPATAFIAVRGTPETFDAAARHAILEALAATGGRIYGPLGAAARLGMPPSTLQGKMQRLGISRSTR
jgi:transcriptional regulator with GAF, ATPase, and Fis domain